MKSITADKLRLDHEPVAILWSNTKPEGALQIKPHGQTCIMPFFGQVAMKGKTAVFDRESYGCPGARAGLGFRQRYYDAFGGAGVEFMSAFFVKGQESCKNPGGLLRNRAAHPRTGADEIPARRAPAQESGEGKSGSMTADLPITDIAEKYVIFTATEQSQTR